MITQDPTQISSHRNAVEITVREKLAFFLILAAALGLRLWNITWGLPELYEEAMPYQIALRMWRWGQSGIDLNPHFFNYPAFTAYLQFFLQGLQYGIGRLLGIYANQVSFGSEIVGPVVFARCTMVLFDVGTVGIVYLIARKISGPGPSLLAAALAAINPLQLRQSHLINVDTPLTFFAVLTVYYSLRVLSEGSRPACLLAGLSIGLAAASKYTGALLVPVLAAAHLLRAESPGAAVRSLKSPRFLVALGASALVFFLFNPYIILSFGEFREGFSFEEMHMSYGHLGIDTSQATWNFYLLHLLPAEMGWPMYAAVLAGMVWILYTRRKEHAVVALFPVIVIGMISSWTMRADRYALPAIPLLIIIAAAGAGRLFTAIIAKPAGTGKLHFPSSVRVAIAAAACVALAYPELGSVLRFQHASSLPDTRTIAKEWIANHLPRGAAYATGPFGIEFPPHSYAVVEIPFSPTGSEALAAFYDTRWYEDLDLLIASDYDEARFTREPERFREILPYYDSLRTRWNLELEVRPDADQAGPTIWLYRPPDSPKTQFFNPELFRRLSMVAETTFVVTFAERLAYALFTKGVLPKSEQLMLAVVSLEPGNTQYLKELAWTQFKLGEFPRALATVDSSLRVNPAQAEVRGLRGSILMRMDRLPEAEGDLTEALRMNSRLQMPYLDLEVLYARLGNKSKLAEVLKNHLKIAPPGSETARQLEEQIIRLKSSP